LERDRLTATDIVQREHGTDRIGKACIGAQYKRRKGRYLEVEEKFGCLQSGKDANIAEMEEEIMHIGGEKTMKL